MNIYSDKGTVLLGGRYFAKGETYTIALPCNHHDFTEVLKSPNYTTLYYGTEVEFVDKVDKREGVFARVRCINTNITYDIDYTNLGEQTTCEEIKKKPSKSEVKEKMRAELVKKIKTQRMNKLQSKGPTNE